MIDQIKRIAIQWRLINFQRRVCKFNDVVQVCSLQYHIQHSIV